MCYTFKQESGTSCICCGVLSMSCAVLSSLLIMANGLCAEMSCNIIMTSNYRRMHTVSLAFILSVNTGVQILHSFTQLIYFANSLMTCHCYQHCTHANDHSTEASRCAPAEMSDCICKSHTMHVAPHSKPCADCAFAGLFAAQMPHTLTAY